MRASLDAKTWSGLVSYLIIVCVMVAGFAWVNQARSASSDVGRQILCTGIIANVGNVARDDPFVVEQCRKVGVDRDNYPDAP